MYFEEFVLGAKYEIAPAVIEKGDMIVMLSDGVLQTGSGESLLPDEGLPPMPSARALASKILKDARKNSECADEMSVCVLRIY